VGTSPTWIPGIEKTNKYFSIKNDSSGVGPSDQTSFYLKDIPVLHFFTGQHSDYHKPTDDFEKINLKGEEKILEMIIDLVYYLDTRPKLSFLKTKNTESTKRSFKVTLGIMPDYTFEEPGLRIDGITENKPASKAGLLQGDIIIQLGDQKINNIQDYMKALNTFKISDEVEATILRNGLQLKKLLKF
jgi:C-terminal processing protease CtpA/Prc